MVGTGSAILALEKLCFEEENQQDRRACVPATIELLYPAWILALGLFHGKVSLFFKPLLFLPLLHQPDHFPNLYSG